MAATGTRDVAEHIGDLNATTSETGSSAAQLLTSASDLARQQELMRSEVEKFLATVRAA